MALRDKNLTFTVGNICNDSDQKTISKAMQEAVVNKIKSKIAHCKFGEVFFVSFFPQYDVEYVTKLLAMFEKEGLISRISKGVYVKARKTRFGESLDFSALMKRMAELQERFRKISTEQ